jgi:SAM-dependent methyltransferase
MPAFTNAAGTRKFCGTVVLNRSGEHPLFAAKQDQPSVGSAAESYESRRREHWDSVAEWKPAIWRGFNAYYHRKLAGICRFLIPPGRSVLELGCGPGDLLAAVEPSFGVGIDLSGRMISLARQRHPDLNFVQASATDFEADRTFDYIILSDVVNEFWDVQHVLNRLHRFAHPHTRVIVNTYSRLWEIPRRFAEALGLTTKLPPQNWLTVEDLDNLLNLADFEVIRQWPDILCPIRVPILDFICNRYLAKLWPFRLFDLSNFVVARPVPRRSPHAASVSIVVPCRNERGNIENIFRRVPRLGAATEVVFVEGNSTDDTYAEIQRCMASFPQVKCTLLKQTGKGKGDAVRLGFAHCSGDILMILDADLTVAPEDVPRFYEALVSGKAEFANGVRLVYPMGKKAMRFFNLAGNKFFSLAFSWLLGQNIKDTLCGTKVLSRSHYEQIAANRSYFGDFDPFGDFDLLFGAAKCNLKIVDIPIRYHERVYGDTNIQRWRDGRILLRMVLFALGRIKFV